MAEFRRSHVATLHERLNEAPTRLVAVFGPRQTGKTTAVRPQRALLGADTVLQQDGWAATRRRKHRYSRPLLGFALQGRAGDRLAQAYESSRVRQGVNTQAAGAQHSADVRDFSLFV